ncbi:MAG: DNA-formamidopyrimidine glycosylase [Proteobacteria bacterium]|nr:MAG: DNA-formamidopyrimidine glycosylase [Pseudomonadota bacterium]
MPELPEVETTVRGIRPHIEGIKISSCVVRESRLRWPVPTQELVRVEGCRVDRVVRRGKYIIMETAGGNLLLHLGMSGSLRVLTGGPDSGEVPVKKHDHIDVVFENDTVLRFNDPRRFGAFLFTAEPWQAHSLIAHLGPEPLSDRFCGDFLHQKARTRASAIKTIIMDSRVVVGVGNIYANEALFRAGIRPSRKGAAISKARYVRLADAIKAVLEQAICQGGTTLKDFTDTEGKPGYFSQNLLVYDREGMACFKCGGEIRRDRMQNRSSYFCVRCQK